MNNIKLILILILVLLFFIQNIFILYKEKFTLNGLDNYLDNQIGRLSLQHKEIEISDKNNLKEITLHKDKLLLTLFYDRYDKYSNHFYDDLMKLYIKKINNHQNEIQKFESEKIRLESEKIGLNELITSYTNIYKDINGAVNNLVDKIEKKNNKLYQIINAKKDIKNLKEKNESYLNIWKKDIKTYQGKTNLLKSNMDRLIESIIYQVENISENKNRKKNTSLRYDSDKAIYVYKYRDELRVKRTDLNTENNKMIEHLADIDLKLENLDTNIDFLNDEILTELENFNNKNRKQQPGAWNQIKQIHKYGGDLYLHKKFIEISEVLCDVNNMDKCHLNTSDFFKPSDDIGNKESYSNTENIGIYYTKRQPYRDDKLVDKLPKVILSFITPDENNENKLKHHIYEYNGIYNYNNKFDTTSRDNILTFLQDTIDKELVIGEHDKNLNKQIVSRPCFPDKEHNWSESNEWNKRPFFYGYKLYKCINCCYFLKEKI